MNRDGEQNNNSLWRIVLAELETIEAETGLSKGRVYQLLGLSGDALSPTSGQRLLREVQDRIRRYRRGDILVPTARLQGKLSSVPVGYCSLVETAKALGITIGEVSTLLQDGRLESERFYHTKDVVYVRESSVRAYKAQLRK